MLEFRNDQSVAVALRHTAHVVKVQVRNIRGDVFSTFVAKAYGDEDRSERARVLDDIASTADQRAEEFSTRVSEVSQQAAEGAIPNDRLAIAHVQGLFSELVTGLYADVRQFAVTDEINELCIQYAARLQAFDVAVFVDESRSSRAEKLEGIESGTLSTWSKVFRDDSIREKDIVVALRNVVLFDEAVRVVEAGSDVLDEVSGDQSQYASVIARMADEVTNRSLSWYFGEVVVPRMRYLVTHWLKQNDDAVALLQVAPRIAHRSSVRVYDQVLGQARDVVAELVTERN